MNHRLIKRGLLVFAGCIFALLAILAIDALIAVNQFDPVARAEAAAVDAGWEVDRLNLEKVEASGGPLGSSAVVTYRLGDNQDNEHLDIHLRRPLFTSNWKIVKIEPW